jgi:hypothetical protein
MIKKILQKIFSNPDNTVVGHFFLGYDIRATKNVPHIEVKATITDNCPESHCIMQGLLMDLSLGRGLGL